ncbi:nitroreductase [Massilia cavernae]|uniref:Nitroreductase n=1 Tax=Massilia cavernae TaxID=2320864 RepID=A0A418X707_9BURK|nr:nitroreductase [Massilia cavernae]RJG08276.1 nitroreductase [Massilia cavernae]
MKASEALASRRSVRAFLERPVDQALIRRVIAQAARSPSGGNLQPWHIYALTGAPLAELKRTMDLRTAGLAGAESTEYDIYPKQLGSPYRERRFAVGEALYASMGIQRDDREARLRWFSRNFRFFDAPMALFCFVDRAMGPPQWSDLGMYLQSLMLLLREEGIDSCPQECWALYPRTIAGLVGAPGELMLFTGMAIGYADLEHPVNRFPSERAPSNEFATFLGFDAGSDNRTAQAATTGDKP